MKIKSIRSVDVKFPATAPKKTTKATYKTARRPSWAESGPVANPMTRYPRYAEFRPSWMPSWRNFGCVVEAEDGTWGFASACHGRPVAAIIDDHLGPRLEGESCLATEKCYDMMVRLGAPYGATGLHAYAVSAIDLALWDLKGKLLQVYELLGGRLAMSFSATPPAAMQTGTTNSVLPRSSCRARSAPMTVSRDSARTSSWWQQRGNWSVTRQS